MIRISEIRKARQSVFLSLTILSASVANAQNGRFAIADVKLFDGDIVREHHTVVLDNEWVVSVTRETPPAGVRLVDGASKFPTPGLTDAHVHTYPDNSLPE